MSLLLLAPFHSVFGLQCLQSVFAFMNAILGNFCCVPAWFAMAWPGVRRSQSTRMEATSMHLSNDSSTMLPQVFPRLGPIYRPLVPIPLLDRWYQRRC